MPQFQTISPGTGRVLFTRDYASKYEIQLTIDTARVSFASWRNTPLEKRIQAVQTFVARVVERKDVLARELTEQMGRPIRYTQGEINGFAQRAAAMISMAPEALGDIHPPKQDGFTRFVRREPLGVVLVLSPWNYPYLTAVNALVPALVSGNTVILKHSEQTALVAERLQEAADASGLPSGVFQTIHATHKQVEAMVSDEQIAFVAFTGSVQGGHAIAKAASGRFIGTGLELGGKDPAYVCADANLDHAIENLVDGAFFNSGQSCCGIERIYVHESLYEEFVEGFVQITSSYVLGDPLDPATTLGPMVRTSNANHARQHIAEAISAGARTLIDSTLFPAHTQKGAFLAPHVLVDVDHNMSVMREETFGPVVGIMSVTSDEEGIALMNDSQFGLTASLWTTNHEQAMLLAQKIETGTVFMNRCDYLDPELAWVGVKNSGRGCTLSKVGYEQLTRPKSFHFRHL